MRRAGVPGSAPPSHKAQGVPRPGCLDAVWMLPRVAAVGPAVVGHSCLVVDALTTHGRRESSRPPANSFTPNFLKVVTDFETESKQLTITGSMERTCMSARATPRVPGSGQGWYLEGGCWGLVDFDAVILVTIVY